LSLRLLQPLAQVLDVFIVRLVLLLVHFQQRPQDFDAGSSDAFALSRDGFNDRLAPCVGTVILPRQQPHEQFWLIVLNTTTPPSGGRTDSLMMFVSIKLFGLLALIVSPSQMMSPSFS
jgi:hypothetical protein